MDISRHLHRFWTRTFNDDGLFWRGSNVSGNVGPGEYIAITTAHSNNAYWPFIEYVF